jgi:uncharacterized repeat protein (TIGR01451 family)
MPVSMPNRVVGRAGRAALAGVAGLLMWGTAAAQTPVDCNEASLRAGIDSATTGAVLVLPDNCTITLTGAAGEEFNESGDLDIGTNTAATSLTIQGAGPGRTIIDGNGVDRVIDVKAGKSLTLRGLTLRNGDGTKSPSLQGGGIYHGGATLTLENVAVTGNTGSQGGGIFAATGPVNLTSVTLSGNHTTSAEGGGLFVNAQANLTNVTVSGNTATGEGGGIYVGGSGTVTLTQLTIAGNSAAGMGGGGIFLDGMATSITHTIIAGNNISAGSDKDCKVNAGALTSSGHNLVQVASASCVFNKPGDQTGVDPKLGSLADNGGGTQTRALLPGSPAIDTGNTSGCPAGQDQRGVSRPQGSGCDIGAYEVAIFDLTVSVEVPSTKTVGHLLRYTMTISNLGSGLAEAVTLTDPLPAGATFVSATSSQGTCAGSAPVTCAVGSVAGGATATVTIVVRPTSLGTLGNTVTVTAVDVDSNPVNNSASASTEIGPRPPLDVQLNQVSFQPGDTLQLTAVLTPGAAALPPLVDAYVVVRLPGGQLFSLTLGGLVPGLAPIATNMPPGPVTVVLFSYVLTGAEPAGSYAFLTGLTPPGTLAVIGAIGEEDFTLP